MKKTLFWIVALASFLVAPAMANITILDPLGTPPSTAPYVYAEWHFDDGPTPNFGTSPITVNGVTTSTFLSNFASPAPTASVTVSPQVGGVPWFWGGGYIYGGDIQFSSEIPNARVEDYQKLLQVELMFKVDHALTGGGISIIPADGEVVYGLGSNSEALGDGWYDLTINFLIIPQPASEIVQFHIADTEAGIWLHSVEVATVCVPAPGALLLAGIGTAFVGWLRKRSA